MATPSYPGRHAVASISSRKSSRARPRASARSVIGDDEPIGYVRHGEEDDEGDESY